MPTQSNTLFDCIPGSRGTEESEVNQDTSGNDDITAVDNNNSTSRDRTSTRAAQENFRHIELEKRKIDALSKLKKIPQACRNKSSTREDKDDILFENDDFTEENVDISDSENPAENNENVSEK